MKKIYKNILIIIILLLSIFAIYILYEAYRIRHAKVYVKLANNLDIEVYSDIKISDLIKKINGKIIDNNKINTNKIGKKEINFKYINDENIRINYKFNINIVDKIKPKILGPDIIKIEKNSTEDISKRFICVDNYDDNPKCEIIGNYKNEIGTYYLTYKAVDKYKNENNKKFILNIVESNTKNSIKTKTYFEDVIKNYKRKNTKIGIDVSKWQGDIDFKKLNGVEFVIIRVGVQTEVNGQYYLDSKYKRNIEGFSNENIPVGVYFYSKADSSKEARKQAKWVVKQIKNYKIGLPIVFDWENWQDFNDYQLSTYHLTNMYDVFKEEVNKKGYNSMLYSSKYYLENIWLKRDNIWLAHYTEKTDYNGDYKIWQICDDGVIDGINGNVDIDIMYKW